jgi:hypothetical protein
MLLKNAEISKVVKLSLVDYLLLKELVPQKDT